MNYLIGANCSKSVKGTELYFRDYCYYSWASLVAQMGKASARNVEDQGSIPRLGRSPGEGNGNPLQYSCLQSPMDRGAWWATVYEVAKELDTT